MIKMINFLWGFIFGSFIFEPIIINFVYFSNIALFIDIILTKKNEKKLKEFYKGELIKRYKTP